MKRKHYFAVLAIIISQSCIGQINRPKLVVGLVIDQMRWDYLYRYTGSYREGGFKRLLRQGFSCENTYIPYVPTYTAVGHSSIYTGSVPALHGIVGNNWYDRGTNKNVYCTDDTAVSGVGTTSAAGKMSPKNLWATTIADELSLSNNYKSKVIGIALKDRGAILPAGHSAKAAYWYEAGKWISSTHYMRALPNWVIQFNEKDLAGKYMAQDWNTLLPIGNYTLSTTDDKSYEGVIKGELSPTFPHRLSAIGSTRYESFRTTPFANTFTFDLAKAAIENERLGTGAVTDLLAISISATDYIGHTFGPNSIEAEDTYLRLDRDIDDFLQFLDTKIGKGNYLLFLTADHGVAHVPAFLTEHNIPAGEFSDDALAKELNDTIERSFGIKKVVLSLQNYQIYLDIDGIARQGKDVVTVKNSIIGLLRTKPFISNVFVTTDIAAAGLPEPLDTRVKNGYNVQRSGDIQFLLRPGYFDGWGKGTTHGLWNPYDSHIPLLWFGWGVRHGTLNRETYMTDIAATLAAMLHIQMPNACVGKVITEVMK